MTMIDALTIVQQTEIIEEFRKGKTLAHILKEEKMNVYIVSRIAQGERTGSLHEACADIATTLKKEKEIKNKLILSLLYPGVLFIVTVGIVLFLVMYIFPKMTPLFMSMKTTLPFTTRTVLWVSASVMQFWWIYILICTVCAIFIFWKREFMLYKIPLIKNWYMSQKISQYFSRIGSYIESGIGLDEAAGECSTMEQSIQFKKILTDISSVIQQGTSFSLAIKQQYIFPEEISSMISVGENSGRLGDMCKKIGELYEKKFSEYTKSMTAAVEPIAMLCMGGVVGFVALSMITPLYSITQNVR